MLSVYHLFRRPPALAARLINPVGQCATRTSIRPLHIHYAVFPRRAHRKLSAVVSRLSTTSTSPAVEAESTIHSSEPAAGAALGDASKDFTYYGPLTTTFRRLKMFSLSSLGLTFAVTPLIFIMETTSALPLAARFALAGIAIGTSGVSTALVSWCGKPYVTRLRWLEPESKDSGRTVEMITLTLTLRERTTRVYDTSFLVPATRPFATWELAPVYKLPEAEAEREKVAGLLPREETIAETMDEKGNVLGRWIVVWDKEGYGYCRAAGHVARHFNVHQELLNQPIS